MLVEPGMPTTIRGAIETAQEALDDVRPGPALSIARAALLCALALLDTSDREAGTFKDAEPFRLVLDPPPLLPPKLVALQPA
jgi:hypothetical protein